MNIIYLDKDPKLAALYLGDKHVLYQILVANRLLSISKAVITAGLLSPKDRKFKNHPWVLWSQESLDNYQWLQRHFFCLLNEYEFRWKKKHNYYLHHQHALLLPEEVEGRSFSHSFIERGSTPPPWTIPEFYYEGTLIESSRLYYLGAKTHLLQYTRRNVPLWVDEQGLGENK